LVSKIDYPPGLTTCPACNQLKAPVAFLSRLPDEKTQTADTRKQRPCLFCYTCRAKREAVALQLNNWDWAAALHKETRMHVTATKDGTWSLDVTPETIRVVWGVQGGLCGCTRIPLYIPEAAQTGISKNATLSGLLKKVPPSLEDSYRVPVLVRACLHDNVWRAGNVILICRAWLAPYRQLGDAATLARFMRSQTIPVIPTGVLLKSQLVKARSKSIDEWVQHRVDQLQEQQDAEKGAT